MLAVQHCRASRPNLREYRDFQGPRRSGPARRELLPRCHQRAGHGRGPYPHLRLSAPLASENSLRSPKSLASDEPDANEPLLFGGLSARWRLRIADFSSRDLEVLLSNGDYGNIFPQLVGMFASGFGLNVLGIIRARAEVLYPATLMVRSYFLVCLVVLYRMSRDPMFLVIIGVVVLGWSLP